MPIDNELQLAKILKSHIKESSIVYEKSTIAKIFKNLKIMKLTKFQIDYVKLIKVVDSKINWSNLIPHPTLKNHYTLNPELSENAKNFSLYYRSDNSVFIKFSIPYFLKGHNYTSIGKQELLEVVWKLKKWLNIDIATSRVEEFEYGAFEDIDSDSKKYIESIKGIGNYNLEKATPNFKMYGDTKRKLHYKVYDAVANSKSKKTYTKGDFPKGNLIKHELKFEKAQQFFSFDFFFIDLYETPFIVDECKELLLKSTRSLVLKTELKFKPAKSDLTNILYTALKNFESGVSNDNVVKLLNEIIDGTNLSSSQKSKRRKSIELLENEYNIPF